MGDYFEMEQVAGFQETDFAGNANYPRRSGRRRDMFPRETAPGVLADIRSDLLRHYSTRMVVR